MQKEENLELYQWPLHSSFTNFSFCTTNFCAAKEKKNVALVHSIKDRITKSFCCNMTSTHAGRTLIKNPQRAEILNSIEQGLRKLAEEGVCAWRTIGTAHKPNHGFSETNSLSWTRQVHEWAWSKTPPFLAFIHILEYAKLFLPRGHCTCYSLYLNCSFPPSWTN